MDEQNNELNEIEREEQELLAQLAAKREIKARLQAEVAERERIAKMNAPVVMQVTRIVNNYVYMQNTPYRDDVLAVVRSAEGRIWRPPENGIPIGEYSKIKEKLETLPNLTFVISETHQKEIHDILFAPNFECDLGERHLIIRASRKAYTYGLRQIPGHNFDYNRDYHTVPLSEGWRLLDYSKSVEGFVWTDAAREFVLAQVENRLRLDEIAKATDVEFDVPGLLATPKNFQKIGAKFFTINGGRGILGDEMGTGKTLQMIMLMLHEKWRALVVCPAPLKENWLREIRKFAPSLKTYTCQGSAPTKYDMASIIADKPDVIIINYDILGRGIEYDESTIDEFNIKHEKITTKYPWVELFNLCKIDLLVLDEGHYIKNLDSNRSKATRELHMPRAISLTGTPILNRPGELWPMLHLADPTTFPAFETFKRQYTFDGKTVRNVDELKQLLKPLMIRRLKKDVIKELPPINRINSYYELSEKGRKLYERVLAGVFDVLTEWDPNNAGDQKKIQNLLVQLQRMKQVVAYDGIEGTADLATEIYDASPDASEGPPNKVLIFSQFKATTYAISRRLGNEALSFVSLTRGREFYTAQSHEQQRLIDQFQSDPSIHYLCVTEKTAKEGHNITAAHAVIFNDLFWTPAGHQQAEARAYGRISDLHTIDSYYRVGVNTISEKILELLAAKLSIIEQVIEGVEASRADTSIIKELLSSLKEEMWTIKKKKN